MDSDDGKEKGGVTAVRKGEAMKSLEKATADYEKAKEKMEASKARYEADLKSDFAVQSICSSIQRELLHSVR